MNHQLQPAAPWAELPGAGRFTAPAVVQRPLGARETAALWSAWDAEVRHDWDITGWLMVVSGHYHWPIMGVNGGYIIMVVNTGSF